MDLTETACEHRAGIYVALDRLIWWTSLGSFGFIEMLFTFPLAQWFPPFFHLCTPWQPISVNCTLHISKMSVISIVAVISNLYVDACAFSRHYLFFSRTPKCPGSYPWGYVYPKLGITALVEELFCFSRTLLYSVCLCQWTQTAMISLLPGSLGHVRKISDG